MFVAVLGGGTERAAAQAPRTVVITVSPTSGPSGTQGTINLTGANPNQDVRIIIRNPDGTSRIDTYTADGFGQVTNIPATFTGSPGDYFVITGQILQPPFTAASTGFTITGGTGSLLVGFNGIVYTGAPMAVEQANLPAGVDVLWRLLDGQWAFHLPTLAPGDGLDEAIVRSRPLLPNELVILSTSVASNWNFPALGAEDGLTVTLDPAEGPTGTTTTLTITGAQPGAPAIIRYNGTSTRTVTADAQGRVTVQETFYGQPGDRIAIEVISGTNPADERKGAADFLITGANGEPGTSIASGFDSMVYLGKPFSAAEALGSAYDSVIILWRWEQSSRSWQIAFVGNPFIDSNLTQGTPLVSVASANAFWAWPDEWSEPS